MKNVVRLILFSCMSIACYWTINNLQIVGSDLFKYKLNVVEKVFKIDGIRSNRTIALISDIHFDWNKGSNSPNNLTLTKEFLESVVQTINNSTAGNSHVQALFLNLFIFCFFPKKDVVIIAGDLINYRIEPTYYLKSYLEKIEKQVICVLGNHDYYAGKPQEVRKMVSELKRFRMLSNSVEYFGEEEFAIVGIEDLLEGDFNPSKAFNNLSNKKIPTIAVTHNPDAFPHLSGYKVDLLLTGHSHSGQILLPFIGSPLRYISMLKHVVGEKLFWKIPWIKFTTALRNWDYTHG